MKADFNDRYFSLNPPSAQQAGVATPTAPQTAAPAEAPSISSAADYQSLSPGSTFISNGKRYQKPAEQAQLNGRRGF